MSATVRRYTKAEIEHLRKEHHHVRDYRQDIASQLTKVSAQKDEKELEIIQIKAKGITPEDDSRRQFLGLEMDCLGMHMEGLKTIMKQLGEEEDEMADELHQMELSEVSN